MEKEYLEEDSLQNVSGGSFEELEEIRSFIKTHDPAYADVPAGKIVVMDWLEQQMT